MIVNANVRGGIEEVLDRVCQLTPERRRTLALELAPRADAPRELMRFLAQDEIVIAEPVILESPVLTEDDFRAIAATGPAHSERLRQRKNLTAAVQRLLDGAPPGETRLIDALRARDMEAFGTLLVELAGTGAVAALDALGGGSGIELARICKQAGLSRAAYSAIVLLAEPGEVRAQAETEALLAAFAKAN